MAPTLSAAGTKLLDDLLADQVKNANLPALFYGISTAEGDIYFNCAGKKNEAKPEEGEVNDKTTLQLFSMTKPITSIACLQLIEKGDLSADDPSYIEKYLPELWSQPILTGFDGDTPITTPRKTPLTLRHLLTHTSGLTYYFMSPLMAKWEQVNSHPSWLAKNAGPESLAQPLMFEPGTAYQYGISLDWAGVLVTRVTGQTLEDYFHQHIFGPSGLTPSDISFYPTEDIKSRLMQGYARAEDGSLEPTPGIRDPFPLTPEDIGLHLGGAGLLGTAKAYMAVSSEILAAKDGKSKVISKQVYDGLFTNAFPPRGETTAYEDLGKMLIFEGVTEEQFTSGEAVGHSLGLCLWTADSVDGQKAGSGFWGGAARTRFWIDPKSDIAGWYGTQIFDMGQPGIFAKAYTAYQREVYKALEA